MEISVDASTLAFFYQILVDLYRTTDDPITLGYSKGMLEVCAERPLTGIYQFIPFPHLYHKATVLMETIIRFHPFADGNKRVSLLATYFFLYWNGYDLFLPEDADKFTVEIAKGTHDLNSILSWLWQHSTMTFYGVLRNKLCSTYLRIGERFSPIAEIISIFVIPVFFTTYPLNFFSYHIAKKRRSHSKDSV
jgi:death-on-curing protein